MQRFNPRQNDFQQMRLVIEFTRDKPGASTVKQQELGGAIRSMRETV